MLESFFPSYQKRLTYKGYSFFINFVILLGVICGFLIPAVVLHVVQGIRLRTLRKQKTISGRKENEIEIETDDENMEELKDIGEYSTFPSSNTRVRIHTSYERLEQSLGSSNSWSFYILSIFILATEICSMFSILGIIDLLLMYGYIHQTKSFMFWKYILWIALPFLSYGRVIFGCRRYEKSYAFLQNKRFIIFGGFAVVFLGFTTSVTIFSSGIGLASHSPLLDGFGLGRFAVSTAFMRSTYPSTCPSDSYPCMTYMTLPENSINEAFINFHINQLSGLDWYFIL